MIFRGVAPPTRSVDPEFFRYELRLHLHYLIYRFIKFNNILMQGFKAFGISIQKVTDRINASYISDLNKEV